MFQNSYHQDFPRVLNGYLASLNVMFAIDAFTPAKGATWVVPGSHQKAERPSEETISATAHPVECPAGSMVIFDSTLWHAAGLNGSGRDRVAINHQFTRSFIKQQTDLSGLSARPPFWRSRPNPAAPRLVYPRRDEPGRVLPAPRKAALPLQPRMTIASHHADPVMRRS